MDWLAFVGNLSSIVGMVLSIFVLRTVSLLRRRYIRQVMFDDCLSRLETYKKSLKRALLTRNQHAVREAVTRIHAVLGEIKLHDDQQPPVEWIPRRFSIEFEDLQRTDVFLFGEESLAVVDFAIEKLALKIRGIELGRNDV